MGPGASHYTAIDKLANPPCLYYSKDVKKLTLIPLTIVLIAALISPLAGQKKIKPKELSPVFRKWLEEEVVYIITPTERDVFLQLETDRERSKFVEAFWRQRDPNPNTPINEFKEEHYKRIAYANNWYGKDAPGPGWESDMGRIHITLGEPHNVEKHENESEIYPVIIWFYEGMVEYGLPNAFNVVFFKKYGMGEYELYTPIKYGPQHLLIHYNKDMTEPMQAYYDLININPSIANVSMNLIHGEASNFLSPSLASEILISDKVPSAPHFKVKDSYAKKLLEYKDIVEVDYSANYIDNDAMLRIFQDPSGMHFVHYLIEPSRLTFEEYQGRFISNLEINGQISDEEGKTLYQFERKVPIEFNRDQIASIQNKLFSYQDMFPLIAGRHRVSVLMKNTVSKEFTSFEKEIIITEPGSVRMSELVLANRMDKNSRYSNQNKPFLVGGTQLVPSPRNDFLAQDTLYLYFQIQGLTDELRSGGVLNYSISREDQIIHSFRRNVGEYPGQPHFFEEFLLENLKAAYYEIKATLLNGKEEEILSRTSQFYISHTSSMPRPWLVSMPQPSSDDPGYANIIGAQYLSADNLDKARPLLEQAYRKSPENPYYALDFCRLLFEMKDYQQVKQVAQTFMESEQKYSFLQILGQSSHVLGELDQAILYYKDYLEYYGTNLNVLNAIGHCYNTMGNAEEALIAWERSLEISPDQPKIKELIKTLREKK